MSDMNEEQLRAELKVDDAEPLRAEVELVVRLGVCLSANYSTNLLTSTVFYNRHSNICCVF